VLNVAGLNHQLLVSKHCIIKENETYFQAHAACLMLEIWNYVQVGVDFVNGTLLASVGLFVFASCPHSFAILSEFVLQQI
jgi:hypothetical protein